MLNYYTKEQISKMSFSFQRYIMANGNKKIDRNIKCPCGSNKKFKKCCWGKITGD